MIDNIDLLKISDIKVIEKMLEDKTTEIMYAQRHRDTRYLTSMLHIEKNHIEYRLAELKKHPKPVFKNPGVTVDIAAFTWEEAKVILIKRKNEPFKGKWAFPGGFIEYGKETIEQAAVREFKEETNIDLDTYKPVLHSIWSNPKRDPRGHTVSCVFVVMSVLPEMIEVMSAKDDACEIKLFSHDNPPYDKMAFDHAKILKKIIKEYF